MKALCCVIALLSFIELIGSHDINVGTVLFTKKDLERKFWTEEERALLNARQVMQGVLPDPQFIDFTAPRTLTVLLQYFKSCYRAIADTTCGETKYKLYLALSDALGGYLRSYILPITKQGNYAGQVKYEEAIKVYQFYNKMKEFLKTDGNGWSDPHKFKLHFKIKPLKIKNEGSDVACDQLYLKDDSRNNNNNDSSNNNDAQNLVHGQKQAKKSQSKSQKSVLSDQEKSEKDSFNPKSKLSESLVNDKNTVNADINPKGEVNNWSRNLGTNKINLQKLEQLRKKVKIMEDRLQWPLGTDTSKSARSNRAGDVNRTSVARFQNKTLRKRAEPCGGSDTEKVSSKRKVAVPLPILDDPAKPTAIGLPFKEKPIRNLQNPNSVSILVYYYVTVVRCLWSRGGGKSDITRFNGRFQQWLTSEIYPRLEDEEWYPAFGGVLRIEETMKTIGVEESSTSQSPNDSDSGFLFPQGFDFEESDYSKWEAGDYQDDHEDHTGKVFTLVQDDMSSPKLYLVLGIVAIVILWVFAFCYCFCCCCPMHCRDKDNSEGPKDERKGKIGSNSSISIECLINFFKRNCTKDEKQCSNQMLLEESSSEFDRKLNQSLMKNSDQISGVSPNKSRSEMREMKIEHGTQAIVMPAQVHPFAGNNLPMEMTSVWPFADFRDEGHEFPKLYRADMQRNLAEAHDNPTRYMFPTRNTCRTLWKRKVSTARPSEIYLNSARDNRNRTHRPRVSIEKPSKERMKRSRPSSESTYSSSNISREITTKRVTFRKRSRSAFNVPCSYRGSYNSAVRSYSSSQNEDEIPMRLYEHIMAHRESFSRSGVRGTAQESDSDRGLTSSSESVPPSLKRLP